MKFPNASASEWLKRAEANLPALSANPYLAQAQRRLQRLRALDLSRTLTKRGTWFSQRRTEAYRLRLAEAWYRAQSSMHGLETQLAAHAPATHSPHSLRQSVAVSVENCKAALLTHYCANVMQYQAAVGARPGTPARRIPAEWMQVAAAAAILSVLHTALMLWVLQRPTVRRIRQRNAAPVHCFITPAPSFTPVFRSLSLPLRL
ncbi:MAG: hypothetical protein ACT4QE_25635 [Anaerolineales bacterium]